MAANIRRILKASSPEEKRMRAKQARARRHERLRRIVDSLKCKPCQDCNQCFPPFCLDFDHRPGEKKCFNIGQWVANKLSVEQLHAEVAKCDLVCACCHRIRTQSRYIRAEATVLLPISHCIHGHLLDADNVYLTSKGYKQCRICRNNRNASRDRRKHVE